jgi:hypothetical protein
VRKTIYVANVAKDTKDAKVGVANPTIFGWECPTNSSCFHIKLSHSRGDSHGTSGFLV